MHALAQWSRARTGRSGGASPGSSRPGDSVAPSRKNASSDRAHSRCPLGRRGEVPRRCLRERWNARNPTLSVKPMRQVHRSLGRADSRWRAAAALHTACSLRTGRALAMRPPQCANCSAPVWKSLVAAAKPIGSSATPATVASSASVATSTAAAATMSATPMP